MSIDSINVLAIGDAAPAGDRARTAAAAWLVPLFATTLFVSAFLLFLVQPMVGKMVLPMLGGSPMVWNACMVFFQLTLLAGYAYAHGATQWLAGRTQIAFHIALLVVPFSVLPVLIHRETVSPPQGNPALWLLALLTVTIGLPFVVLSTSASVLQQWFSRTDHPTARDPYFLYTSSNLGSFLALAAYPTIVEPILTLHDQSRLWTIGYAAFVVLACSCAVAAWRFNDRRTDRTASHADAAASPITLGRRARWVALAFIPSSLMLAVTTYLSTDIAAVPLLWTVPLGLYLLTFVVVFSSRSGPAKRLAREMLPLLVVPLALLMATGALAALPLVLSLHLLAFVAAALHCHGGLADDRPDASHLTEFYLWISVGGMLGGLFNALAAPVLFTGVYEYPIVLVLACLFLPQRSNHGSRLADFLVPVCVGAVTALLLAWLGGRDPNLRMLLVAVALPAFLAFTQRRRPVRFGLSIGALIAVGLAFGSDGQRVLYAERTFFGVYRVKEGSSGVYRVLAHGTTIHGMQADSGPDAGQPLTYFHRTGPLGQAFSMLPQVKTARKVGVTGLGIGTLAAYSSPGQHWTFYEIDPAVEGIARNSRYFNFLDRCADRCRVVVGDARLSLAGPDAGPFDIFILDAFSSDSIPIHLITKEALGLYLSKLAPNGVILFQISNRHLRLEPMVGNLAAAHNLVAFSQLDLRKRDDPASKLASNWAVMARQRADLGAIVDDPRWRPLSASAVAPLWTDDFSNILSVLHFQ